MKLSHNETARIVDDEMPLFCCDDKWNVLSTNDCMKRLFPEVTVGTNISSFFNNTAIFLNAKKRLSKNLPYVSTNFELFSQKTTICFVPINQNTTETTSAVCSCFLEMDNPLEKQAIYNITDSYRSPITDIINSSAVLARRLEEIEDYNSINYLNHIVLHCYNMLKVTTTSQNYYKLLNNATKVFMKKTDINDFISSLNDTLKVLFAKSDYSIIFSICDEKIISEIDFELLSLAIFHLIANSCNFSPLGAAINVSLEKSDDQSYIITVSDNGDGIDSENMDKIFSPFFSYHSTSVPEEKLGVGLGLNIVKLIADIHGATVFINTKKNAGTTVSVKFPIKSDDASELTVKANTTKYITNKFSNCYILFADICDIKLY